MVENDRLIFAEEQEAEPNLLAKPWKILIVDDDEDVHTVTKLALDSVIVNNRPLSFISAHSASQAKELLTADQDIALIFLDVVMEHNLAGLDVVDFVRKKLNNSRIRIIIRTGEPGSAPERMIIDNYDINDYKEKTELNARRLYTTVRSSLLQYEQLQSLYAYQNDLEQMVDIKMRENAIQAEALIESSRHAQMGDFLNMISHQWRQPLSRIAAVVSQMKLGRSLENLSDTELDEMLDSAEVHVQNLAKIIRDFQNLYRTDENKSYDTLSTMLENTLNLMHESLHQENIRVEVDDKSIEKMPKLRTEMNQVFVNILKNAFDAIVKQKQKSGLIQIRLSHVSDDLIVEIEDNAGLNWTEPLSDKIFEPYVSDKAKQGKGLGLYICKMIVEKHCEGKISVNQGSAGACFKVQLPIQKDRC